jgi:hypothetical protein
MTQSTSCHWLSRLRRSLLQQRSKGALRVCIHAGLALIAAAIQCLDVAAQTTQVIAWGSNSSGQRDVPPSLTNAIAISSWGYHNLALRADGTVIGWGENGSGQAKPPSNLSNVVAVATGVFHSLAIRADGSLVAWADYAEGATNVPADIVAVKDVAGGFFYTAAILPDGTLRTWGRTNDHELINPPVGATNLIAVALGGYFGLGLRADGSLMTWGEFYGFSMDPKPPAGLSNVVAIDAGDSFCVALKFDGTLAVWGGNPWDTVTNIPPSATNLVGVSASGGHIVALRDDGTVLSWGCDCDDSTIVPSGLSNVVSVVAGGTDGFDHSLVLQNPTPHPEPILSVSQQGGFAIWISGLNRDRYVLETTSSLEPDAVWQFSQNILLTNSTQRIFNLDQPATEAQFYRVRLIR